MEYGILKRIKVKAKVNEKTGRVSYRTVFTNRSQNGETEFASMFIRFVKGAKDTVLDDNTYIKIKDGFLSFNLDENGRANWVLVIADFDIDNESSEFASNDNYSDDDLPFWVKKAVKSYGYGFNKEKYENLNELYEN